MEWNGAIKYIDAERRWVYWNIGRKPGTNYRDMVVGADGPNLIVAFAKLVWLVLTKPVIWRVLTCVYIWRSHDPVATHDGYQYCERCSRCGLYKPQESWF